MKLQPQSTTTGAFRSTSGAGSNHDLAGADVASFAFHVLGTFAAKPNERARSFAALAAVLGHMPAAAAGILTGRGADSSPAASIAWGTIHAHRGQWNVALQSFSEARLRAHALEPSLRAASMLHVGRYLCHYGSYDEAADAYREAQSVAEAADLERWCRIAALARCELAARRGAIAESKELFFLYYDPDRRADPREATAGAALGEAMGDPETRAFFGNYAAALAALERLMPYEAATILQFAKEDGTDKRANDLFATLPALPEALLAMPYLATVAAHGSLDESVAAAERLNQLGRLSDALLPLAFADLARAHVNVRSGRQSEAIEHAERSARRFAAAGDRLYERRALDTIVSSHQRAPVPSTRPTLTKRQSEIVALLQEGYTNKDLAAKLHISEHTVERHLTAIFNRLNLRSRWQLAENSERLNS